MTESNPTSPTREGGIHLGDASGDVRIQAGGDIVAGDKTVIQQTIERKASESTEAAPYKFLSYYEVHDRDIFFGRDTVIDALAGKIPRHKVLIINGQSGAGKTSLINAGLIPRLADNDYLYVSFRDYSDPLVQLRGCFAHHRDETLRNASAGNLSLPQILAALRDRGKRVVVIFDQFERFLLNVAPAKKHAFIVDVKECLDGDLTSEDLNLVFALREDFFGRFVREIELVIPTFFNESAHYNLGALSREEAREAIIRPLKNVPKMDYDRGFVDEALLPHLLREGRARIEPSQLQIVCSRLYDAARERNAKKLREGEMVKIDFDLYHDLGETEGILRDYLDDCLQRVTGGDRERTAIVRSILKLMVESAGMRKFESLEKLSRQLPDVNSGEVADFVRRLQDARAIERREGTEAPEYSLSHEVMVEKVRSWYDEREMERRRAQETLERGLTSWTASGQRSVLDEVEIELVERWLPSEAMADDGRRLLEASRRRQRRLRWGRWTAWAGAGTMFIVLVAMTLLYRAYLQAESVRIRNSALVALRALEASKLHKVLRLVAAPPQTPVPEAAPDWEGSFAEARKWLEDASRFRERVVASGYGSDYVSERDRLKSKVENKSETDESLWTYDSPEQWVEYELLQTLALSAKAVEPRTPFDETERRPRFLELRHVHRILETFVESEEAWEEARNAISGDERYKYKVTLKPIPGLLPIGRNDEGRWEFEQSLGTEPVALTLKPIPGLVPIGRNDEGWWEFEQSLGLDPMTGEPVALTLVLLPAGKIPEGADTDHQVKGWAEPLAPFFIAKYEVTQRQWLAVMGENPSYFQPEGNGTDELPEKLKKDEAWLDLPVEMVSWYECQDFCKKTGLVLPWDVQWEYACRAGTTTPYSFGNTLKKEEANTKETGLGRTEKVGSYPANRFGLHDMHGNVWEWCEDVNEDGARIRGGSYHLEDSADYARSGYHARAKPIRRSIVVGVRPARIIIE
jgi:formylglycine-generating enzyme required for sulfatase activity